jgi:hypothetical protein
MESAEFQVRLSDELAPAGAREEWWDADHEQVAGNEAKEGGSTRTKIFEKQFDGVYASLYLAK